MLKTGIIIKATYSVFVKFQLKDVLIFVYVENRYYNISHIQCIRNVPIHVRKKYKSFLFCS